MLNSNSELKALTGLRGVAALTVALAHYNLPILGAANRLFFWHNAAVDLFFCLSGFTLALVYVGQPSRLGCGIMGVARFARIYPLYIASLRWQSHSYACRSGTDMTSARGRVILSGKS